jgi:hypothetical protein
MLAVSIAMFSAVAEAAILICQNLGFLILNRNYLYDRFWHNPA